MTDKAVVATATKQIQSHRDRAETLRNVLLQRQGELKMALPRHITSDRMIRLVMTTCLRTPAILECSPASVYGAMMQCAQLGLEPDARGQAYLVPFFNKRRGVKEVQFVPGYQGLLTLARRSGDVDVDVPRVVRDGDHFKYAFGLSPALEHTPHPSQSGELTHVYAIGRLKSGHVQFDVMTREQIDAIRNRSKSSNDGPWVTDYEAMALKTVLRRLCKYLPSSIELQTAIALDERAEAGMSQDLPGFDAPIDEATPPRALPAASLDEPDDVVSVEEPGRGEL